MNTQSRGCNGGAARGGNKDSGISGGTFFLVSTGLELTGLAARHGISQDPPP